MAQTQSGRGIAASDAAPADDLAGEAIAVAIVLIGILTALALASQSDGANLIGRLGTTIHTSLTFALGKYVAYLIPVMVLASGFTVWRGTSIPRAALRILGVLLASICTCALIAIPFSSADFAKSDGFYAGGAVGNFLVHKQCLHLTGYLGSTGTTLLFIAGLALSVSLATDVRLRPTALAVSEWVREADFQAWRKWLTLGLDKLKALLEARPAVADDVEEDDDAAVAEPSPAQPARPSLFRWRRLASPPPLEQQQAAAVAVAEANELAAKLRTVRPAPAQPDFVDEPSELPAAIVDVTPPAGVRTRPAQEVPGPSRMVKPQKPQLDDLVAMAECDSVQEELQLVRAYETPSVDLFNPTPKVEVRMSQQEVLRVSDTLEKTLSEFGIVATVVQVTQGPTVTRFEIAPAPGVKVARIASLENDIAMCMKADSVRIIAPVPGRGTVGLEVPNKKATPVYLREMFETDAFRNHPSPLAFALGKTISGDPYICDLATMPHMLIAGTTGSGKSVCLNSVICSMLHRMEPDKVKFVMIDPKRVELNVYQAIPHLLAPVVCEPRKAAAALSWAIEEMEDRYKKLASLGVRNIDGYNAIVRSKEPHPKAIGRALDYMPHIVIVIDELADLMIIAKNEVEDSIIRLAQMSRAVGMHLILATQRPSVNVITGIIKANFPSRVAFQVSSKVDSRTILDTNGAETLLGRGDMLFSPGGSPKPMRLQGCYVSDPEVERLADWVRSQARANYVKTDFLTKDELEAQRIRASKTMDDDLAMDGVDADDHKVSRESDDGDDHDYTFRQERLDGRDLKSALGVSASSGGSGTSLRSTEDTDAIDEELFQQAVRLILTHRKASVSLMQRKLKIGFARAGRVMDMLEEEAIVGPNVGSKVREILVDPDEYLEKMDEEDEERF